MVSFQQKTIFSCLSCKQRPVSVSYTYNRIVPLTRHLGGFAEKNAQNPRQRKINLLRPRRARKTLLQRCYNQYSIISRFRGQGTRLNKVEETCKPMLAEFNVKSKSKMLSRGHIVCVIRNIKQLRRRPRQERHTLANLTIKRAKRFTRVYFHFCP